ncbi:MAG: sulfite exporter TauE/SafE family protein [Nitrospira sp. NTP1]|nr:sulfite exporter TauE/SafE family protein [Nitrospira sp. NTP1]
MIDQALRAVLAGVPIGLQLGATGTGGGILGVPLMVYIAGMSLQQAAAMSLMIVGASSLVGACDYGRKGMVKPKAAAAFSWTGMIGSWGGAFGHHMIRQEVLLVLFGLLLLLIRAVMARQRHLATESAVDESCAILFPRTCWIKVGGIGLIVGTLNGLFGVGGGFMVVPALILVLGFPAGGAYAVRASRVEPLGVCVAGKLDRHGAGRPCGYLGVAGSDGPRHRVDHHFNRRHLNRGEPGEARRVARVIAVDRQPVLSDSQGTWR